MFNKKRILYGSEMTRWVNDDIIFKRTKPLTRSLIIRAVSCSVCYITLKSPTLSRQQRGLLIPRRQEPQRHTMWFNSTPRVSTSLDSSHLHIKMWALLAGTWKSLWWLFDAVSRVYNATHYWDAGTLEKLTALDQNWSSYSKWRC